MKPYKVQTRIRPREIFLTLGVDRKLRTYRRRSSARGRACWLVVSFNIPSEGTKAGNFQGRTRIWTVTWLLNLSSAGRLGGRKVQWNVADTQVYVHLLTASGSFFYIERNGSRESEDASAWRCSDCLATLLAFDGICVSANGSWETFFTDFRPTEKTDSKSTNDPKANYLFRFSLNAYPHIFSVPTLQFDISASLD